MNATVFLGGGRIAGALLAGLRLAGYKTPIVVHDRNAHKLSELKRKYDVIVEPDLPRAIAHAHLLIVAVRPDSVGDLLASIRQSMSQAGKHPKRPVIACSLAAEIPLAKLRARLPVPWARAMPSPVCRSGNGLTAVTFDNTLSVAARNAVRHFFRQVGSVVDISEEKFDVFTVTYSCSHGYHALTTLARAATKLGLDRKTALTAAAHALADGIASWREGDLSLQALLKEAATPGGIAETVTRTMQAAGYARAVERGLRAGVERASRNAGKSSR